MPRLPTLATIVLLSLPLAAPADTITLHPTGVGSIADWDSTDCPGTDWDCLNDQAGNAASGAPAANDGDTSNLQDNDGSTGRVMVALDDGLIAAGATITAIEVHGVMKKSGGGTPRAARTPTPARPGAASPGRPPTSTISRSASPK